MIRHMTLNRYFGRQYLLWFVIFISGLSGIIFLFEVAELLRRAADHPDTTFLLILKMAAYKLPETIEKILPFVVLFSGMFTFWRLTRSQELIIARAIGLSVWQFLTPALLVTLAFGLINLTLVNPLGAAMNGSYRELEMRYLQRVPTLELTGAGLWLLSPMNAYPASSGHNCLNGQHEHEGTVSPVSPADMSSRWCLPPPRR